MPGVVLCAVNVTLNERPAWAFVGFQCTVAVAGLPNTGSNDAPRGRPSARIETLTIGAPGAVAASPNTSSRPTRAVKRFPSSGVGAVQVAAGVAVSRAETDAGKAKHASAATTRVRCRPPSKRRGR